MLPSRGFLMLSKPVEKTTHVSLVPDFTPGPSSGVRVCFFSCSPSPFSFLLLFGYPLFESFAMSLEDSDDLNILDAAPIDLVLEAGALPKFDMHLYRSSLNESHVRYLVKLYGIPEELYPRVVPEGMTMDALHPGAIGLYAHHFQQGAYEPDEYNASNVAKLREVVISLRRPPLSILYVAVITMVEFLRLPNFKGYKVVVGTLLPPGAARVTHLAPSKARLEDILPKTGDMIVADILCRKVVDDKEKKKRKVEEKATTKAPAVNVQAEAAVDKPVRREGLRKKRRLRARAQAPPDSEHVSSPTPLNQAKPLVALANEEHASLFLSVGWMDTLRDQTDEHAISPQGGLSGLQIRPNPFHHSGQRCYILEDPAPENVVPDKEASYFTGRFGNLPFTPLMGAHELEPYGQLTELAMVRSAYDEKVSAYDQLSKNYDGAVTLEKGLQDILEELKEEKKEAGNLNSSQVDRIRQLEEALKQAEVDAEQLRAEKVHFAVEVGNGEIVRQKIMNQYLPTFVYRLHQSAEYKRSLGQVFTLAVGKGFIDDISIGRKEDDIQAILKATPNIDPTSSETFLTAYEKLFDQRYPYVDKVARMYLLDPTELPNIMTDETGPTPDGGPRDTSTVSYA
nr:hypothetical protein [Tanacetum cinerariifolium]